MPRYTQSQLVLLPGIPSWFHDARHPAQHHRQQYATKSQHLFSFAYRPPSPGPIALSASETRIASPERSVQFKRLGPARMPQFRSHRPQSRGLEPRPCSSPLMARTSLTALKSATWILIRSKTPTLARQPLPGHNHCNAEALPQAHQVPHPFTLENPGLRRWRGRSALAFRRRRDTRVPERGHRSASPLGAPASRRPVGAGARRDNGFPPPPPAAPSGITTSSAIMKESTSEKTLPPSANGEWAGPPPPFKLPGDAGYAASPRPP